MPVTLSAAALVDLPTVKDFLGLKQPASEDLISLVINRASELLEAYCDRPLKSRAFTDLRLRGPRGPRLYPPGAPVSVASAVTVYVAEQLQTVWRTEADGDPLGFDVQVAGSDAGASPQVQVGIRDHLYRSRGWAVGWEDVQPYNVRLTYTGGLSPVPADLQLACLEAVQRLWRDQDKNLSELVTLNLPGGGVTFLDTILPRRCFAVLDTYRRRSA